MTEAKRLLALTDKYSSRRRLAFNCGGLPVNFLFIPYRHKRNNGFFVPGLTIFLSYGQSAAVKTPRLELGHAFQYYSIGDVDTVPDSFMEVYNQMFKPSSREYLPEVFADCFSVCNSYALSHYLSEETSCIYAFRSQGVKKRYGRASSVKSFCRVRYGFSR